MSLLEAFNCAGGRDESFQSKIEAPVRDMGSDSDFERKIRSERDANRAIIKASEQTREIILSVSSPDRQSVVKSGKVAKTAKNGLRF